MLGIFGKLLDSNEREIKKLKPIVDAINALEKKVSKLTDKELQGKLAGFRLQHERGKSLDELLPEAFAAVREASSRTIKQRHFDVQMMAAITLHQGKIAEQKTGEGKTLSATPALFLNAVSGKGVHLVTVNDYLAQRDCGWMGPVFNALGAIVATIVHDAAFIYDPKHKDTSHDDKRLQHLRPVSRKEAYEADIIYGTNNEFGFDYFRDNMVFRLTDQSQRGHFFAVVDEVDSILIDEARTPLIISQPAQEATQKYYEFAKIIDSLSPSDYVIDEKQRTAHLTEHGTLKIEKMLGVDNLYEKDFYTLHHLEESLKAKTLFQKDKDYVVKDGEVIIVDEFTGRLMEGRRYSEGLHQAIEAKEGVTIQQESQTLATISFQNYFRMYQKLSGMTGTAATEAEEFHKIYKLDVVVIPTNRPMIRIDHPDTIYKTQTAKYTAVAELIGQLHEKGQPVLVGTTSIEKNEFLSDLLKRKKISHALLNAKNHEKEAEIISRAGEKGAVTVATNMAGRGVDIKLGKGTEKEGGLFVIGTERHESRRIDNQLRGLAGRQGDPGQTRFFVSLEDDLMRIFGGEQIAKLMNFFNLPEDQPLTHSMVTKAIEQAQVKVEGYNFDIRKHLVEFDDVLNKQREIIYDLRRKILYSFDGKDNTFQDVVFEIFDEEVNILVNSHMIDEPTTDDIKITNLIVSEAHLIVPVEPPKIKTFITKKDTECLIEYLSKKIRDEYAQKEKKLGKSVWNEIVQVVFLSTIDTYITEHLTSIADLREGINLRGYAQMDPLVEYKNEAYKMFEKLMGDIKFEITRRIFKVEVQHHHHDEKKELILDKPAVNAFEVSPIPEKPEVHLPTSEEVVAPPVEEIPQEEQTVAGFKLTPPGTKSRKIGRNDPCWCGSGKKYKKCHYPD